MYDANGNLKAGYTNERSFNYRLLDLATGCVLRLALRTPNEAADLNQGNRNNNLRWVPVTQMLSSI